MNCALQVALEFLSDRKSKFLMSLEVGHMDEALEAAKALNDKVCSHQIELGSFSFCCSPSAASVLCIRCLSVCQAFEAYLLRIPAPWPPISLGAPDFSV